MFVAKCGLFSNIRLSECENLQLFSFSLPILDLLACAAFYNVIKRWSIYGNRLCWVLCGWPVLQKEIKCHSAIHRTLIIRWSASLVWPRCSLVCYPQETRLASIANETIETHNHSSRDLVARAGDHCLFCSLLPFVKRKPHYLVWSFPVNI